LNFGNITYCFTVSCLLCEISIPHGDPLQFGEVLWLVWWRSMKKKIMRKIINVIFCMGFLIK